MNPLVLISSAVALFFVLPKRRKDVITKGPKPCPGAGELRIFDPATEGAAYLMIRFNRKVKYSPELAQKIETELSNVGPNIPLYKPMKRVAGPPAFKFRPETTDGFLIVGTAYPKGHPTFDRPGKGLVLDGSMRKRIVTAVLKTSPTFAKAVDVGRVSLIRPVTAIKSCAKGYNEKIHDIMVLRGIATVDLPFPYSMASSRQIYDAIKPVLDKSLVREVNNRLGSRAPWLMGPARVHVKDTGGGVFAIKLEHANVVLKGTKPQNLSGTYLGKALTDYVKGTHSLMKTAVKSMTLHRVKDFSIKV